MKLEINLLPPSAEQARRTRLYSQRLGGISKRLAGVLLLLLGLIGVLYALVWRQHTAVGEQVAELENEAELRGRVEATNQLVGRVQAHAAEQVAVSNRLEEIVQLMPASVSLTGAAWDAATATLTVQGTFSSREAVTEFKRSLETLSWVAALNSPLSNFTTGVTPEFIFMVELKP